MNDEFILEVINPTTTIAVLPSYEDSGEGVILAVSEPLVEVTPSLLAPEITTSIAVNELYILVIDVAMLEAWQNDLNVAVISLNNLWISHNELSGDVAEQLSAYNLFVDHTTLSIIDLENTDQNLLSSIQSLELSYTDLEGQISVNTALINANILSIEQTEESINVNTISISSLSTQLSDLNNELDANSILISQNISNIQANDGSIASLGIAVTAIEVEIAGYGAIYASAGALDALDARVEYNENGIVAVASHITELEASIPFGFNAYTAWEFRDTLEGWQAAELASAYQLKDCAVVTGDGYIFIHLFATPPIDGSIYDTITMTWRTVVPGGIWEGKIYYKNNNETTWQEAISFEQFTVNTFKNETFILSSTNWINATQITDIAVRFSSGGTYDIDSIGVGRRSGTGSYGSITEEAYIRAAADGSIEGKYGVKIDVNGKVSGFGLIQTANNDEPYSEFNFNVDALNIYDPDSNSDVPLFHLDSNQVAFSVPIIQSVGFATGSTGTGWRLNDNGVAEFHGITIYDDAGEIILASGAGLDWNAVFGSKKPSDYADVTADSSFVTVTYPGDILDLQEQIDGKIETWYTNTDPSLSWGGDDVDHIGDMWWNTSTHKLARWLGSAWSNDIEDQKAIDAYANAATAQDTADGKRRVFVSTPTIPYDIGDLWDRGSTLGLWRASVAQTTAYSLSDWAVVADTTSDNTAADIVDQGNFATLDQVTSSNISTYIANLAIGSAQVDHLSVNHLHIANAVVMEFYYGYVHAAYTYYSSDTPQVPNKTVIDLTVDVPGLYDANGNETSTPVNALITLSTFLEVSTGAGSTGSTFMDVYRDGYHLFGRGVQSTSSYYANQMSVPFMDHANVKDIDGNSAGLTTGTHHYKAIMVNYFGTSSAHASSRTFLSVELHKK